MDLSFECCLPGISGMLETFFGGGARGEKSSRAKVPGNENFEKDLENMSKSKRKKALHSSPCDHV